MVEHLDKTTFFEVINSETKPVIVDFYADWCVPCKMLAPLIEELASERRDVRFCKVNVDHAPEIAADYGVRNIPALVSFRDGQRLNSLFGVCPKDEIMELIS
ncbi:MAG: thioredoxin [Clostridiales bacterium]|jgi:thioredoxin 1|nr:thioredoxin [Clostridiales bacterium]